MYRSCGEACPASVVDAWAHNRTFLNGYGVTESICAIMGRCRPGAPAAPPIGKPLPNVAAYVLDASLNIMPPGATGELYLGGEQLARGYLGQPGMTAERFVASPFGRPGSRMYRTGDLVRGLPSGELEFVGRADDQVKIRGFRVELAEVEAALRQHPDVFEARVVTVRDGMRGRLVAYTVPHAGHGAAPSASALRKHLLRLLPDHMVPVEFVTLDALPLTRNGKLDKAALPMPRRTQGDGRRSYTAPRSDLEAAMARIWEAALGADRIGVTDNFFDAGGDSILSMQVVSQARRAGLDVSPRQMFMHQTIAALAEELAGAGTFGNEPSLPGEPRDAPLAPAQRELFRSAAGPWGVWQSVLLEFDPSADIQALRAALGALLAHHGALGTRFEEVNGQWRQHGGTADLESVLRVADQPRADQLDASAPSGPPGSEPHWPPVQVLLLPASGGMRLLFRVRGLVVDDFSWRILMQDLVHGYRQAAAGGSPDLGLPTATFWEWSARLADDALTGLFDDELGHWRETAQRALGAPRVSSADGVGSQPAVALTQWLDVSETAALTRHLPGYLMVGVDEMLLAAVAVALAASGRSRRVCVGVADSSREYLSGDLCTDRTVGSFTAAYPCVLEIPPSAGLGAVVGAVRRQLRDVPRRGLGYAALGRSEPVPDVVFSYAGEFGDDLARCGARILRAPGPDPDHRRYALSGGLEIRSWVVHGRLQIEWAYPPDRYTRKAVEALAREYMRVLRDLAHLALPA